MKRDITKPNATCLDLLCYLYSLTQLDLEVLLALLKRQGATLDELALVVKRDRTTVFRSLQKLVSAGLCHKEAVGRREGGYYHVYSAASKDRIKTLCETRIDEITNRLKKLVQNLDSELESFTR
ncbi:hypothetical protein B9Q11_01390 [Candidatus Marsarchaeota G2 archaeon ECH_B_SAG-F08]|jgi:predicted transcriptional regulator|uniref:Transcription regulator TrmB N-terminal domain-containing protein n=5 Tax=Candidatus Marsarchaeota TaxID=1978152 RepID=A0A2R6ABD0_9ARCH|nr:MAG: hypothetical protein B9Q01_04630 [Candidatus Marsarchaeota G1 archaeon OSP_D]PSN83658.1 MAG: hypothetical protein B9Q02_10300 [Candidatus Marsarchaeota G1 archaeon BE_D]PSN88996.1 MAG: hypothetical protein B9Q00_03275 [Candidatus Marsarchaeota G1 archaeon OSP_C]PSN96063.1 MAG: hypothetical protein B9P99_00600 [Candidatus Marsarchaeota G1 archaeon OSP_B]PSN99078.1 MAG: hypothetical protein B9Q11_01390 [Candidatus Marsarchaeota G2 archaeon ECH_B_SAG-F08]